MGNTMICLFLKLKFYAYIYCFANRFAGVPALHQSGWLSAVFPCKRGDFYLCIEFSNRLCYNDFKMHKMADFDVFQKHRCIASFSRNFLWWHLILKSNWKLSSISEDELCQKRQPTPLGRRPARRITLSGAIQTEKNESISLDFRIKINPMAWT